MRKTKTYKGAEILTEYNSSNIKGGKYNTDKKTLQITFSSGAIYEYANVPHEVFSAFDNADSQGKYFNSNISKKFDYKKV